MSLNGYGYVEGNVVNAVDPDGRFAKALNVSIAFNSRPNLDPSTLIQNLFCDNNSNTTSQLAYYVPMPPQPPEPQGDGALPFPEIEGLPAAVALLLILAWLAALALTQTKTKTLSCDDSPYNHYIKCNNLRGYNNPITPLSIGDYNHLVFSSTLVWIGGIHNTNPATLVPYSQADGLITYQQATTLGAVQGDVSRTGPCGTDSGYTVGAGKHWNVWENLTAFNNRLRNRGNVPPLYALGSCKCCDISSGIPLVDRFAVVYR